MDSVKEEMTALHKRNNVLEKDNAKMKDQVQETNFLLKTLVGQFSQVIGAIHQGKSSLKLLACTQELSGLTQQHVLFQCTPFYRLLILFIGYRLECLPHIPLC
ncbi:Cadherin-4 [Bienertia sinuspersici]